MAPQYQVYGVEEDCSCEDSHSSMTPSHSPTYRKSSLNSLSFDVSPTSVISTQLLPQASSYEDYLPMARDLQATYKRVNKQQQPQHQAASSAFTRITVAATALVTIPFLLYRTFPATSVWSGILFLANVWDSLLHISSLLVAAFVLTVSVYWAPVVLHNSSTRPCHSSGATCMEKVRNLVLSSPDLVACVIAILVGAPVSALGSLPMIYNSWAWYPFGLGRYHMYYPSDVREVALRDGGVCVHQPMHTVKLPSKWRDMFSLSTTDITTRPLCLPESSWKVLSSGGLSSYKKNDVRGVLQGIDYAQQDGHGLTIGVLARDIRASLPAFRANVESLQPFFPHLAVVIFENDSQDGSRDAIREWATASSEYEVDLMDCPEAVDCKFGKHHRDEASKGDSYTKTKAIGDMDVFRQRVTDYIKETYLPNGFSHMMVVDIDLAVSFSPFGILHALGSHPDSAVASSGRQLYPMSFGSLDTPYDFSAFRPADTPSNSWLLGLHEQWCQLMPPGDRWRNSCDAPSPFLFSEMIRADRGDTTPEYRHVDFYRVQSAFNGAVLYPLALLQETDAVYDAGDDGQRCEHIGFNLRAQDEQRPMYVNRRWDMHVDPANMAGPTGWRAQNAVANVTSNPRVFGAMTVVQVSSYFWFVYSMTMLGLYLVYPLVDGSNRKVQRLVSSHQRKLRKKDGQETLFKLV